MDILQSVWTLFISVLKFWSFPSGPHEPTVHRNPVKRYYIEQGVGAVILKVRMLHNYYKLYQWNMNVVEGEECSTYTVHGIPQVIMEGIAILPAFQVKL